MENQPKNKVYYDYVNDRIFVDTKDAPEIKRFVYEYIDVSESGWVSYGYYVSPKENIVKIGDL